MTVLYAQLFHSNTSFFALKASYHYVPLVKADHCGGGWSPKATLVNGTLKEMNNLG